VIDAARDLKGFSKPSRDLVRRALGEGWTGRMSARGHAILHHPSGATTSISRGSNGRKNAQAKADLDRVTRTSHNPKMETSTMETSTMETSTMETEWTPMGREGRHATRLDSEGVRHWRCGECMAEFGASRSLTGHYASHHVERKPRPRKAREGISGPAPAPEVGTAQTRAEKPEEAPSVAPAAASFGETLAAMVDGHLASLQARLEVLEAENARLRGTLDALSDLARESLA
jgi:hypothetical protein